MGPLADAATKPRAVRLHLMHTRVPSSPPEVDTDINRYLIQPGALDERWGRMDELLEALRDWRELREAVVDTPVPSRDHPESFYSCIHHGMDIAQTRLKTLLNQFTDYGNGREQAASGKTFKP